jgi:hypothetical protein
MTVSVELIASTLPQNGIAILILPQMSRVLSIDVMIEPKLREAPIRINAETATDPT